ncbi:hypothetical protein AB0D04_31825 [Streptomyces sp. NPDC048483]|uniref:hypothetical protein n=1 Tax=Streptomyces sp. NPDC048483 TaxID=3154927 RepID=UPI0034137D29
MAALPRTAVAVACASIMSLGALTPLAQAAPRPPKPLDPGMPCFEYFDLLEDMAGVVDLPTEDHSRPASERDTYEYENPAKKWDGLGPAFSRGGGPAGEAEAEAAEVQAHRPDLLDLDQREEDSQNQSVGRLVARAGRADDPQCGQRPTR